MSTEVETSDERIARADPHSGEIVGEVAMSLAHREGIWHATIHVWILDDLGRLIFQHRSPAKEHYPDQWDVSVGGHLRHDEDGTREVAEELGVEVNLDQMDFVGIATIDSPLPGGRDREKPRVYVWRSGRSLDSFAFADGEVVGLASVTLEDLERLLGGARVPATVFDGVSSQPGSLAPDDLVTLPTAYWTLLRGALYQS